MCNICDYLQVYKQRYSFESIVWWIFDVKPLSRSMQQSLRIKAIANIADSHHVHGKSNLRNDNAYPSCQ